MRFLILFVAVHFSILSPEQRAFALQQDEIVVVGERTGPRLWRVQKDDAELYVLVSVPYLPADLEWDATAIEYLLDDADHVFLSATGSLGAANAPRAIGAFVRTMTVNRGRVYMNKNTTLADKVGAELAADFNRARARVDARLAKRKERDEATGNSDGTLETVEVSAIEERLAKIKPERTHPYFQSQELSSKAVKSAGLESFGGGVEDRIRKLAKKRKVKAQPVFEIDFQFSDLKLFLQSVKDFSADTNKTCGRGALNFAENELADAHLAAQAWARGDVDALREVIKPEGVSDCIRAVSRELGGLRSFEGASFDEVDFVGRWVEAVDQAMAKPGVRLAIVYTDSWLREDGIMARLGAAGYQIRQPE